MVKKKESDAIYHKLNKLKCKMCFKKFTSKKSNTKYCCLRCKNLRQRQQLPEKVCCACHKHYKPTNATQKYCSWSCSTSSIKPSRSCLCELCGRNYHSKGRGFTRFCNGCRTVHNNKRSYEYMLKYGRIEQPGVGKGGNQFGDRNPNYKHGKRSQLWQSMTYRYLCLQTWGGRCVICDQDDYVEAHHVDGNPSNNVLENLVPVCKLCHNKIHSKRHKTAKQYEEALFNLWPQGRNKIAEINGNTL